MGSLKMRADFTFVTAEHQRAIAIDGFVPATPHLLDLRLGGGHLDHLASKV